MAVIVSSASGFAAVFFDHGFSQSELEVDDIVNDFEGGDFEGRFLKVLASRVFVGKASPCPGTSKRLLPLMGRTLRRLRR
jgi:hypothetical protein